MRSIPSPRRIVPEWKTSPSTAPSSKISRSRPPSRLRRRITTSYTFSGMEILSTVIARVQASSRFASTFSAVSNFKISTMKKGFPSASR